MRKQLLNGTLPEVPSPHDLLQKAADEQILDLMTGRQHLESSAVVHELFEEQVALHPTNIALTCRDKSWTYQELEHRANQLARHLRANGVGVGSIVGVYFDRSERPIIGILATLKAGAAYIPIDPCQPVDRVRHILTESKAAALLTETALSEQANEAFIGGRRIFVDAEAGLIAAQSSDRLSRAETGVKPEDLAYVLYTSGTTGRPKGVMIEHRNVVGFAAALKDIYRIQPTDRVYHGFSLGFDASVEELWMAFSNGAALIVATSDVVRLADEVARLINGHKCTVYSTVPTFLSIIEADLPAVRLLILGGEPCGPELVRRWAKPGRRMLNTYGPTETTVDATWFECHPEKRVTIGRPLKGYEAYVLDENLKQVAQGEPGELCIGGVGVARGYLGQPELTQKQFVPNPFCNGNGNGHVSLRLYRTGDLVRLTDEGEIDFMGRIDRQVKIRGFRIELAEIESVLCDHPSIKQAVVEVFDRDGLKELAAFVIQHRGNESIDRDDILQLLRNRLPSYMVPGYLDVLQTLPTLTSGKVDRKQLPKPTAPLVPTKRDIVRPTNEVERKVCQVWEKVLEQSPISIDDDFFRGLGGYSLMAAQVVTKLRNEHGFDVAIRDIYQHPTVRKLAEHLQTSSSPQASRDAQKPRGLSSRKVFNCVPRWMRWTCVGLQAVSLTLSYGVISLPLLILILLVVGVVQGSISLLALGAYVMTMTALALPLSIGTAIALKWLVIRRYKPGRYPLWSFYYFRWWLATRIQATSGIAIFQGTPVMSLYYRLMGAKVGKNCIIDTSFCSIYDLLTIGDDTCIGSRTQVLGYRVEDGMLIIGSTDIGSRCFIGSHSALGLNVRMGDDCYLDDQSLLPDGAAMSCGEARRGSPAQPAAVGVPRIATASDSLRRPFLYGVLHFLVTDLLGTVLFLTTMSMPTLVLIDAFLLAGGGWRGFYWAIGIGTATIPLDIAWFCINVVALKRCILRRLEPGVYSTQSPTYLRKWAVDILLGISGRVMYPFYATVYLPFWLRMLGAKIGKRAEIAMVGQMTPDLIDIGDESFFADGSTIGGRRFFRGHVQFGINRIGSRTFVGNGSVLPVGASLGSNSLLGVLSTTPGGADSVTPDNTEWLGSPPFQLPNRVEVVGFDVTEIYQPTLKLCALRCLIDAVRIFLPIYLWVIGSTLYATFVVLTFLYVGLWPVLALAPAVATLLSILAVLAVVGVKRLLIGKYHPIIKPLWSVYVWLNEVVNGAWETTAAPLLTPLMGTPFLAPYLRLMGCKIGKHTFIQTTYLGEFDMVDIGDYAAVNLGAVIQNHLFEDRIMKSSHIKIGNGCSIGNMAVVLYDTELGPGSTIGPLSLLMKGETVPAHTRWLGIPTSQVKETTHRTLDPYGLPKRRTSQPRRIAGGQLAAALEGVNGLAMEPVPVLNCQTRQPPQT